MNKVLTFIMAGGKGERLSPLTKDRTKPAVPFGGVYRIIDFTLSNCINSGLRKIHVLTQYKSYSLTRHIAKGWGVLNGELGEYIDVIPAQQRVDEHWYQGTADSIYQNLYAIEDENPGCVLILAGDHIYKMDYRNMLEFHKKQKADLTIGVVEVPRESACSLGVCDLSRDSKVRNIIEKPSSSSDALKKRDKVYASMGIYVFNQDILKDVTIEDSKDSASGHDFAGDIIPRMINKYKIYAYNFKDDASGEPNYWRDVGDIDAYYEANMDLVQIVPKFNLYDRIWPFRTYQEQFGPSKTVFVQQDNNRVGMALNSLVSNGCIISGGKVQASILSSNVRINSFSEVTDSILMEGVDVGRHSMIRRTIIDKNIKIPPKSEIGFDMEKDRKRFHVTASGIVVIPKGTVL